MRRISFQLNWCQYFPFSSKFRHNKQYPNWPSTSSNDFTVWVATLSEYIRETKGAKFLNICGCTWLGSCIVVIPYFSLEESMIDHGVKLSSLSHEHRDKSWYISVLLLVCFFILVTLLKMSGVSMLVEVYTWKPHPTCQWHVGRMVKKCPVLGQKPTPQAWTFCSCPVLPLSQGAQHGTKK